MNVQTLLILSLLITYNCLPMLYRVKLARDKRGNKVALKILGNEEGQDGVPSDDFYTEVQCLQQLDHPNLCKLQDYSERMEAVTCQGKSVTVSYLALEYIPGADLYDWIKKLGKFNEKEALFIFKQVIAGVHHMHSKGYFHRDIKPANILLNSELKVKLVDFGFSTQEDS